jgi:hypothetical protein
MCYRSAEKGKRSRRREEAKKILHNQKKPKGKRGVGVE